MIGEEIDLKDRYRGSLLGLAVGDALGTTLEFKDPGTFDPLRSHLKTIQLGASFDQ